MKDLLKGAALVLVLSFISAGFALLALRGWDIETCGRVQKQAAENYDAPFVVSPSELASCASVGIDLDPQ